MKLESLVCDVEGCVDAAIFQIHHFMVLTEPHAPGANLHFDLCKKHAEAFAMTGTGSWQMKDDAFLAPSRGW